MQQIADVSGGAYFRATDNESLAAIYRRSISWRRPSSTRNYHTTYEEFFIFVPAAALPPSLRVSLRSTILRTNP